MTFFMVFTQHLPTLALVSLGASETIVGIQSALHATELLQLPALRAVARVSKRSILILGQTVALLVAVPLLFFDVLSRLSLDGSSAGAWIALLSLALATASINVSNTVWFPMLRSYVEPTRIGRFFGVLRSGWHLALIFYYLAAQYWLVDHPGDYGPLFLAAWLCGLLRVVMIWRLPERSERTGERIRIREAVALVRTNPLLRRYLVGVTWAGAVRMSVVPFVMVMMRREVGFSSAQVLFTTVASFAGGLASLYLWGRVVDRIGPAPVFRMTALGMGTLTAGLVAVQDAGAATLVGLVAFFFLHTVLVSGFGVADTHTLFGLTPPEAPARMLVIASVVRHGLSGLAPILSGVVLDRLLETAGAPLRVYHGFFAVMALGQALCFLPLRGFRRVTA
jgi:MFS family permease